MAPASSPIDGAALLHNQGKLALVFGVRDERSLAHAIAQKLHMTGARVAVSYTAETRDEVLHLMQQSGMEVALSGEVDVRDEAAIEAFVAKVTGMAGKIDYILHGTAYGSPAVMCASPPGSKASPSTYLNIPFDELVDSFDISAYSLLRICRVAMPHFASRASVLTLSYHAAQKVFAGYAGMAISKAALENLVIYLAEHLGPRQVRVNAISAGLVMTTSAMGIEGVRTLRKIGKQVAPLGNVTAEDIANTAIYYFSDMSAKTTGHIHYVDGGLNIMGITLPES